MTNVKFKRKTAKIRDVENDSISPRNHAVAYYQTLEEVPCLMGLENHKKNMIKNSS